MRRTLLSLALTGAFVPALAQQPYTTSCLAQTSCTNAGHIGNAARSLMVDPDGTVTTSSNWDENNGSVQSYRSGVSVGSILSHGGGSGAALAGNSAYFWVPGEFNAHAAAGQQNGFVTKVNRATGAMTVIYGVSTNSTERWADTITGANAWGHYVAFSDPYGQRIQIYSADTDALLWSIPATSTPGAVVFDRNGNIWVAQGSSVVQYSRTTGTILSTITLDPTSNVTALYFDPTTALLWVADSGPNEHILRYTLSGTLASTFGLLGGYRNADNGAIPGSGGPLRFMRIDGIGRDSAGNIYILNQPWGMNFDRGRTGGTNIQCYTPTGTLLWQVGGYNFEGIGDPNADASLFYSGQNIYSPSGYVANTVDPFTYPTDERLQTDPTKYAGRNLGFGQVADFGSYQILVALDQNSDTVYFYIIRAGSYLAQPIGSLPGALPFNETAGRIRAGFDLASNGDVLASFDRPAGEIYHYHYLGLDANGLPSWSSPTIYSVPSTLTGGLGRLAYLPLSHTMILASKNGADWTSLGSRVEVYANWPANQTTPTVITLNTALNPKTLSADGSYLFVGYVHTVPNIDAYSLATGALTTTFTSSNSTYVGNDIDSMYGLRCKQLTNSSYTCAKDNYNGVSIVIHNWTPQ